MAYLPGCNLGCPDKSAELCKRMVKIEHFWLASLLTTTCYRPRLNTVYLCFTSSHGWSLCHEGKTVHLCFYLHKVVAPGSPFFSGEGSEVSFLKMSHFDGFTEGDKTPSKKCLILMSAMAFSANDLWMQYFTKNWAWDHFVEITAPSNRGVHAFKQISTGLQVIRVVWDVLEKSRVFSFGWSSPTRTKWHLQASVTRELFLRTISCSSKAECFEQWSTR